MFRTIANSPVGNFFGNVGSIIASGADVWGINLPNRHYRLEIEQTRETDHFLLLDVQDKSNGGSLFIYKGHTPTINEQLSASWLLGRPPHMGAAGPAVALLTLPFAPIYIGLKLYYKVMEDSVWGHSRHHQVLVNQLGNQLTSEQNQILREAVRNTHRGHNHHVTFDEAKSVLKTAKAQASLGGRKDEFNWGIEHNGKHGEQTTNIAHSFHDIETGELVVIVFETTFTGKAAEELVKLAA